MLSFLEFIDHYDLDILLPEKDSVPISDKKIIITYSFLIFFFKKKIHKPYLYRSEKNYKKKFIDLLKESDIPYSEMTFYEIYKLEEKIDFNKILEDCSNKTDRTAERIKWIVLEKRKFHELLNGEKCMKKYNCIKEIQKNSIYNILNCYSEYLNKDDIDDDNPTSISVL